MLSPHLVKPRPAGIGVHSNEADQGELGEEFPACLPLRTESVPGQKSRAGPGESLRVRMLPGKILK